MSGRISHCGDQSDDHAIRRCVECQTIARKQRRESPQPTCRSCRIRFRVKPLEPVESYNPIEMSDRILQWLENAALVFDAESGDECFTASEFMAWLRPDIKGHAVSIPEVVGKAIQKGGNAQRHNMADPIPYYKREPAA